MKDHMRFLPNYFTWHYTAGFRNIWGIWTNYLWFFYNFFSISLLLKTLLSPWRSMSEIYHGGFDLKDFGSTLIINTLMRVVGLFMRFILVSIGCLVLSTVFLAGIVMFALWFLYPVISIVLLLWGVVFLTRLV